VLIPPKKLYSLQSYYSTIYKKIDNTFFYKCFLLSLFIELI